MATVSLDAIQDALLFIVVGMLLYAAGLATAGNRLLAALCTGDWTYCPANPTIKSALEPWIQLALVLALGAAIAFIAAKRVENTEWAGDAL